MKRILIGALCALLALAAPAFADTLTTNLLLNKQTVGGNINTWGTNLNSNFESIDDKLGTVTTINTTGGTTVLSTAEELAQTIKVTGTLASNAILQFSGRGGIWIINNGTTGAFTVTAKQSGQTGVEIVQGEDAIVYSDATDVKSPISVPESAVPIGAVSDYAGTTEPDGWLFAWGQCLSTTTYSGLFAAFGSTDVYDTAADCGAGLFKVPDLRGRVVAGQDDMGGTSANRLVDGTDSLNGDTLGDTGGVEFQTIATAELPSHTHGAGSYAVGTTITNGTSVGRGLAVDNVNQGSGTSQNFVDTFSSATLSLASGTVSGTSSGTGSGTALGIVQPTIILNKIIYSGV